MSPEATLSSRVSSSGPPDDGVEVGELVALVVRAPVVLVAHHLELAVAGPGLEDEGAGADRVGAGVLAEAPRGLDREREAGRAREVVEPRRVALLQHVVDAERPRDLHGDAVERARGDGSGHRQVLVERLLEDVGVQGGAVVEGDALAQRQRVPRVVVVHREGLGQVRLDAAVLDPDHEGVVDRAHHRVAGVGRLALAGQPAVGLGLQTDGDRAAVDGITLVLVVGVAHAVGRLRSVAVTGGLTPVVVVAARSEDQDEHGQECEQSTSRRRHGAFPLRMRNTRPPGPG